MRALIRRHPLPAFFVIAFALTWVTVPLGRVHGRGPLVAALIVIGVTEGRARLRELGRRMIRWRVGLAVYAAAILVPLGVALAAGGRTSPSVRRTRRSRSSNCRPSCCSFALRLVVPVFAPIGEEPGWRGFALPRYAACTPAVVAR